MFDHEIKFFFPKGNLHNFQRLQVGLLALKGFRIQHPCQLHHFWPHLVLTHVATPGTRWGILHLQQMEDLGESETTGFWR